MNSIVCLETIAVFVFGFCLICESTLTNITIAPNDTSVVLGGNVKLECFTADKNYPPTWSYQKVESGEKKDISLVFKQGDLIVPKLVNGFVERHRIVENRTTGEYSLEITAAKPEDAGIYTCTPRGGLSAAEKRSAELSVFEPSPVCASNITEVVGENDCNREPDVIEFSCKFRVHGKYLPKIKWTGANHPETVDTPTMDDTGMASSKLIIKGNHVGLDKTSFRCMIASKENADDNRFACVTPQINVLKITNLTESKVLEAPEEVECTQCAGWTKLNASGCEWLRRDVDDNGQRQETHVTSKSLLNLYRSEMKPGTYFCVANCNIRGEPCRVKLLKVSYKPPGSESVQSGNANVGFWVPVLVVVALVVIAIIIGLLILKRYINRRRTQAASTVSSDSILQNQPSTPLLHGNRSSTELQNGVAVPVNVPDEEATKTSLEGSDSGCDSGTGSNPSQEGTPPSSQDTPLTGSDSSLPSQQGTSSSQEKPNHSSYDIPDAKIGGLTKAERIRLMEERAEARMRANAALRSGENNPAFSPDTDVAEGVPADKKKHE